MANTIYESLQMDLPALADILRRKGRGKDTILAHITPKEAALLKKRGGRGSINPDTGLPEFDDEFVTSGGEGTYYTPSGAPTGQVGGAEVTPAAPLPTETYQPTFTPAATPQQTFENQVAQTQAAEDVAAGQYAGAVPTGQTYQQATGFQPAGATVYAPTSLTPEQLNQVSLGESPYAPTGNAATTTTTTQPKSIQDRLLSALSDPANLAKLGILGGLGVLGTSRANQAAEQGQAAAQQIQQVGQPYTNIGQAMYNQALQGQLTPANMQSYQAAQAQLQQDIANRGGVGVQQAANQLSNIYNTLLTNQLNQGLQVAGIGDQYQIQAIQTGLASDQALAQQLASLYQNLAGVGFGVPMMAARSTAV